MRATMGQRNHCRTCFTLLTRLVIMCCVKVFMCCVKVLKVHQNHTNIHLQDNQCTTAAGATTADGFLTDVHSSNRELLQEAQVGMECGRHAVNAVLCNLGKLPTDEDELRRFADLSGETPRSGNYDMATLLFLLLSRLGDGRVQAASAPAGFVKQLGQMLSAIGQTETIADVPAHCQAALRKQAFSVKMSTLQWVIVNVANHWLTFLSNPMSDGSPAFSRLDSLDARAGIKPALLFVEELCEIDCAAIIIPTPSTLEACGGQRALNAVLLHHGATPCRQEDLANVCFGGCDLSISPSHAFQLGYGVDPPCVSIN